MFCVRGCVCVRAYMLVSCSCEKERTLERTYTSPQESMPRERGPIPPARRLLIKRDGCEREAPPHAQRPAAFAKSLTFQLWRFWRALGSITGRLHISLPALSTQPHLSLRGAGSIEGGRKKEPVPLTDRLSSCGPRCQSHAPQY